MIEPLEKDWVLLASMNRAFSKPGDQDLWIWWLGQSGFLLIWNGRKILLDPYLSDSLSLKYAETDKPHVRMSERVIDPHLLQEIDLITSSHNHTDHLDADTLIPIIKNSPKACFIIPEANRSFVCNRLGCAEDFPVGLDDGLHYELGDISIYGVLAAHNEIERDHQGRSIYLGYILKLGSWTIYHSGDTMLFDGMEDGLKKFNLDVAFLPINGYNPVRRVAGNLDGREAAELGKAIGAGIVIPHHFDLFEFNTASPDLFESTCRKLTQKFRTLKLGEGMRLIESRY